MIKIHGLCDLHDYGWANSDHGGGCKTWKRIRDNKPRKKITVRDIL